MSVSLHAKILNMVAKHVHSLTQKCPDGVEFILNQDDLFDIQADVFGPSGTPYEGGVFRCVLKLDSEFPQKPPKGYFLTKIFHPNIAPNGEICVNTLKKDWDPMLWSFYNILEVIKCLLIVPFPESSLNEEASKLFMEDYEEYMKRARLYTSIHGKKKATDPSFSSPSKSLHSNFSDIENKGLIKDETPKKLENTKEEDILTSVTNKQYYVASPEKKLESQEFGKIDTHSKQMSAQKTDPTKKKWMKRI